MVDILPLSSAGSARTWACFGRCPHSQQGQSGPKVHLLSALYFWEVGLTGGGGGSSLASLLHWAGAPLTCLLPVYLDVPGLVDSQPLGKGGFSGVLTRDADWGVCVVKALSGRARGGFQRVAWLPAVWLAIWEWANSKGWPVPGCVKMLLILLCSHWGYF